MELVKLVSAIVFMSCFLLMAFSKGLTLLNFYLNQDAIVAKYCVNKDKPKMHCDGKCFLAKKIKEQDQRDATHVIMELASIDVVSASHYFSDVLPVHYTTLKQLKPVRNDQLFAPPFKPFIFKPPIC